MQCSAQNSATWDWKWNFENRKKKTKIKMMKIYSLLPFWSFLSWHRFYKEMFFFSMGFFFHKHWIFPGFHWKEGYHALFPFTIFYSSLPFPLSRKFRHLLATLHATWLPHIFICIAYNYQTATRWYIPTC